MRFRPTEWKRALSPWHAAITRGDVRIERVAPDDVEPFVMKLREVGAVVDLGEDHMRVRCNARPMATDLMTMPHPGFPTDLQQPFAALLATAEGTSVITENVYERRFRYVNELIRMGADIKQDGPNGRDKRCGQAYRSPDCRVRSQSRRGAGVRGSGG